MIEKYSNLFLYLAVLVLLRLPYSRYGINFGFLINSMGHDSSEKMVNPSGLVTSRCHSRLDAPAGIHDPLVVGTWTKAIPQSRVRDFRRGG